MRWTDEAWEQSHASGRDLPGPGGNSYTCVRLNESGIGWHGRDRTYDRLINSQALYL